MTVLALIPDRILRQVEAWLARRRVQQDLLNERTNPYGLDFDGLDDRAAPLPVPRGGGPRPIEGRAALAIPPPE